jgi:hypothetical protein
VGVTLPAHRRPPPRLDPKRLEIVGIAEDDRCCAGGRVTFDEEGYAYVMGNGRNQSVQVPISQ